MELLVEASVDCPVCFESLALTIDTSMRRQSYYEDCVVCCHPLEIEVSSLPGEVTALFARRG